MTVATTFPAALKRCMHRAGYANANRLALALRQAGHQITYAQLHAYLTGINRPHIDKATMLADFLGCSVDELIGRTPLREFRMVYTPEEKDAI